MNVLTYRAALSSAALLMLGTVAFWHYTRSPLPQDICEAAEACERQGLYWTTGAAGVPQPVKGYSGLTISLEPITMEQAALLYVGAPCERWRGKARVYSGRLLITCMDDTLRCVIWGNVTLIGDPDLVDAIVAR